MDVPEPDWCVCWVVTVGAYLKPCAESEQYHSPRGVGVEEICREQVWRGESVRYTVPVDLTATSAERAAYSIVGAQEISEGIYLGQDIGWSRTRCFKDFRISC